MAIGGSHASEDLSFVCFVDCLFVVLSGYGGRPQYSCCCKHTILLFGVSRCDVLVLC